MNLISGERVCAFTRAGVLWPALPRMPDGSKRTVVPGGGTRMIPIGAGDHIRVFCPEGGQPAEILLLDHQGNSDPAMLGQRHDGKATGIMAALQNRDDPYAMQMRATLDHLGIELCRISVLRLFDHETPAWTEHAFTAEIEGYLFACAPEHSPRPEPQEQHSATEIWVYVQSSRPPLMKPDIPPPPPLLDPLQDFTIQPGYARPTR